MHSRCMHAQPYPRPILLSRTCPQDANATIKRQLQRLLLGASIFLDVDDLEEIGDLELYVQQSVVINGFLSHSYFQSKNCLREVQAALERQKPLMLTREADTSKGGRPIDMIKHELADTRVRAAVFCETRYITTWYRIADFQLISLKQIAEFMLRHTPDYIGCEVLPIFVPGELLRERLCFKSPVTLFASKHNPGAIKFAAELKQCYEGIRVTENAPVELTGVMSRRRSHGVHSRATSGKATHFLLYLNHGTFLNTVGARLAEELQRARAAKVPMIMVHENDPERGGCEFGRFFGTTPQDLIDDGLYSQELALAAYPGKDHRAVSLALCAKALDAQPQKDNAMAKSSRVMSAVMVTVTRSGVPGSRASPPPSPYARSVQTADASAPQLSKRARAAQLSKCVQSRVAVQRSVRLSAKRLQSYTPKRPNEMKPTTTVEVVAPTMVSSTAEADESMST